MPIEITVPRLGWSMEEGTFAGWLKADGDPVAIGEPIYALESEKVTMEVESLDNGTLHIPTGAPTAGAAVTVGRLLGYLLQPGETPPSAPAQPHAAGALTPVTLRAEGTNAQPGRPAPSAQASETAPSPPDSTPVPPRPRADVVQASESIPSVPGRTPASPRARVAAKNLGIDISTIQPREGAARITEADVLKNKPGTSPRATIANRMEEAFRAPHFYLHADANVEALAALRHRHRPAAYNDFLIKAIAIALVRHPRVNAYWNNGSVTARTTSHIAIAAQIGDTLYTPIIANPAEKSIAQIARDREQALAELANFRAQRLLAAPNQRRTFVPFPPRPSPSCASSLDASATLSNLGPFGVDRFEAVLNPPQSIIVAVGNIAKRPVVIDDQVVARLTMPISLSVDHRVVDGVPAAAFLQTLIAILESPAATYNEWE